MNLLNTRTIKNKDKKLQTFTSRLEGEILHYKININILKISQIKKENLKETETNLIFIGDFPQTPSGHHVNLSRNRGHLANK